MSNNMKAILTDKIHFELCEIGKEYIDKYESGKLDIYEMVAILSLKLFDKGATCMREYIGEKQCSHK